MFYKPFKKFPMLGTSWSSKCEVLLFSTGMTSEKYPGPSESDALLSKYLEYFLLKFLSSSF